MNLYFVRSSLDNADVLLNYMYENKITYRLLSDNSFMHPRSVLWSVTMDEATEIILKLTFNASCVRMFTDFTDTEDNPEEAL